MALLCHVCRLSRRLRQSQTVGIVCPLRILEGYRTADDKPLEDFEIAALNNLFVDTGS